MSRRGPYVRDRKKAQWGGYLLVFGGVWLLYDAYERRGRTRPFLSKFVPG